MGRVGRNQLSNLNNFNFIILDVRITAVIKINYVFQVEGGEKHRRDRDLVKECGRKSDDNEDQRFQIWEPERVDLSIFVPLPCTPIPLQHPSQHSRTSPYISQSTLGISEVCSSVLSSALPTSRTCHRFSYTSNTESSKTSIRDDSLPRHPLVYGRATGMPSINFSCLP